MLLATAEEEEGKEAEESYGSADMGDVVCWNERHLNCKEVGRTNRRHKASRN